MSAFLLHSLPSSHSQNLRGPKAQWLTRGRVNLGKTSENRSKSERGSFAIPEDSSGWRKRRSRGVGHIRTLPPIGTRRERGVYAASSLISLRTSLASVS